MRNRLFKPTLPSTKTRTLLNHIPHKIIFVANLFWNNLQTKHNTFKVIDLCQALDPNKLK